MNITDELKALISRRPLIFLGMGSEIRGDDGWAFHFILELKKNVPPDVHCIWAATAPESFFAPIAKLTPGQIIICDAGDFKAPAGTYRLFSYHEIIDGDIFFTHRTSLKYFGLMLEKRANCPVHVLLLQPQNIEISFTLSQPVQQGMKKLLSEIASLFELTPCYDLAKA